MRLPRPLLALWILALVAIAASSTSAATVRWIGAAQDVKQVSTIAASGTWATGDTATLTINKKSLTVTIGAATATTDVVAALAAAVNAADATAGLVGTESRNFGGQEIAEFTELVATAASSTLTLTGSSAGVPVTITRSENTAGSGALGAVTAVTAATGKNFFNNADNWEGGALPSAGDTIVFDSGAVDVLYGLTNATLDYQLRRTSGYSGAIGLLKQNPRGYVEYRTRFLALPVTATSGTATHFIGGESSSAASGRSYLDFGTNTPSALTLYVQDADGGSTDGPAVQIVGGKRLETLVYKGTVGVGTNVGQNATTVLHHNQSYVAAVASDAAVRFGSSSSFINGTNTINQQGGTLILETDCSGASNEIFVHAGTLTVMQIKNVDALSIYGGRVDFRGDQVDELKVFSGGEFDMSASPGTNFVQAIELYRGFTFRDPLARSIPAEIHFNGCTPSDGTLELRNNLAIVPSSL